MLGRAEQERMEELTQIGRSWLRMKEREMLAWMGGVEKRGR